jgi:hypothetical protein
MSVIPPKAEVNSEHLAVPLLCAAVQMIDTSVVRVHQHGACIADNNRQNMDRSRGACLSKAAAG